MALPEAHTRYLFFTGKGGVGKTSLSCAMGLALADAGKRVLIVSTDPASNLDEVLGTRLSSTPTLINGASVLYALNIDPEAAAQEYRERIVAPYRGVLPTAAIASMEEQLSGACTVEIAAFDEFSKLIGEASATADFDHVIFDTAPTGHTLRLLTLPSAWSGFIASSAGGASCLGPLAGLEKQKALYAATVARLSDPALTSVILVSRPEFAALREAERTRGELGSLGVRNLYLALNGVFTAAIPGDAVADAMTRRSVAALAAMPAGLAELPRSTTPLISRGTVGLDALRELIKPEQAAQAKHEPRYSDGSIDLPPSLADMVDSLAEAGRGIIMTMGKGGVGKTTVAAAIALALAQRGHAVHLSTTDPAAHVAQAMAGDIASLTVSRIDPALKWPATPKNFWLVLRPIWMKPAEHYSKRICAPLAPRKLLFSAHSLKLWIRGVMALWCWTQRPLDTLCYCSMLPKPSIVRYCAHREICQKALWNCCRDCVIRISHAY